MIGLLKKFFSKINKPVNIREEFKRKFGIQPQDYTEYETSLGKMWITHQFVDENYAKVYVLKGFKGYTPVEDKNLKYYVASITLQAEKPVYYEVFWEEL